MELFLELRWEKSITDATLDLFAYLRYTVCIDFVYHEWNETKSNVYWSWRRCRSVTTHVSSLVVVTTEMRAFGGVLGEWCQKQLRSQFLFRPKDIRAIVKCADRKSPDSGQKKFERTLVVSNKSDRRLRPVFGLDKFVKIGPFFEWAENEKKRF